MPASDIAKFAAGFLYKFVGDNHLAEIEGCAQGGEQIEVQIKTAIADFEKGGPVAIARGIAALKNVLTEIPTEFKTCKAIGQDIKAIEEWAKIFTPADR